MRAKRRTEQEQYDMIMECRQSGLSDHQWCLEHDINPGTFYNWEIKVPETSLYIFIEIAQESLDLSAFLILLKLISWSKYSPIDSELGIFLYNSWKNRYKK